MPNPESIRAELRRLAAANEVVTPIRPEQLAGTWWTRRGVEWPARLGEGVIEPRDGYRFRPECLALTGVLESRRVGRMVDLGAGTGALLLIGIYLAKPKRAVGLELQAEQADRVRRTLDAHGFSQRAAVLTGDLRDAGMRDALRGLLGGPADLVVTNPPYFPSGWGRPSQEPSTRWSTHAEHGGVREFLAAAVDLLEPGGLVLAVYDAGRLVELLVAAGEVGLGIGRVVWIPDQRPGRGAEATRCWVELRRDGAGVEEL